MKERVITNKKQFGQCLIDMAQGASWGEIDLCDETPLDLQMGIECMGRWLSAVKTRFFGRDDRWDYLFAPHCLHEFGCFVSAVEHLWPHYRQFQEEKRGEAKAGNSVNG